MIEEFKATPRYYLIVAKYRFGHFNVEDIPEQERLNDQEQLEDLKEIVRKGRSIARKWFGIRKGFVKKPSGESWPEADLEPADGIVFKQVASFYVDEDQKAENRKYGWMAIVGCETYQKMRDDLRNLAHKDALVFNLLFDIQVFQLGNDPALEGVSKDVYATMTPEHWKS